VHGESVVDGRAGGVEGEPGMAAARLECAEIDATDAERLGDEDAGDPLLRSGERRGNAGDSLEIVAQRHALIVDSVP
jgi:hypothetical protein